MSAAPAYREALAAATQRLQKTSASARIDAESLLCHVLDCNSAHLAAWPEKQLNAEQAQRFEQLLGLREAGKPVAYLTGSREFWSLELDVSPATLIPRPETETLVEFVLEQFDETLPLRVADLGTGSGAIAIALASERPGWSFIATDRSEQALQIASANAAKFQLDNIEFRLSHWFEQLQHERFDLIISNPPYVAAADPHLTRGDVLHEPLGALAAGEDGMDDIDIICRQAGAFLNENGWLVLEHGYDQQDRLRACLQQAGFGRIVCKKDLAGQPRMSAGRIKQLI